MSYRESFQYLGRSNWGRNVTPLMKLFFSFMCSLYAMISWNPYFLFFLCCSLIVLLLSLRPPLWKIKSYMQLFVILVLVSTVSQAFFFYKYYRGKEVAILVTLVTPRKHLFWIVSTGKGLVVSIEGGVYGLKIGVKMCIALLSGLFVILTTRPLELFRSLLHVGVPSSIALMAIAGLKFVPTVYEEFSSAVRAFKMKGYNVQVSKLYRIVKLSVANAIYRSIRRAMILGLSLDLRGFSGELHSLKKVQYSVIGNIVVLLFLLVISSFCLFLHMNLSLSFFYSLFSLTVLHSS